MARADNLPVRNCTWCHGTSGQGYMPAPRLAGQRAEYIETQLLHFRSHARDNPFSRMYMWSAAANLGPSTTRRLAIYFADLYPKAANDGRRDLAARGMTIYQVGIPEVNVAACAACHGPAAQGVRDIPRLGGLGYSYLKTRLRQWAEGYDAAAKAPMPHIASKLPPDVIDAVASYLSFVK